MTKWEYQNGPWREVAMMGDAGWEAFSIDSNGRVTYKRPVEDDPRDWVPGEKSRPHDASNPASFHPPSTLDHEVFEPASVAKSAYMEAQAEINRNRSQLLAAIPPSDVEDLPETELSELRDTWVQILDAASNYVGSPFDLARITQIIRTHYDDAPGTAIRDWDNGAGMAAERIQGLMPRFNLGMREAIAMRIDPEAHWAEAANNSDVIVTGRVALALKKAEEIIELFRGA